MAVNILELNTIDPLVVNDNKGISKMLDVINDIFFLSGQEGFNVGADEKESVIMTYCVNEIQNTVFKLKSGIRNPKNT
jgi:hypothetical protein